MMLSRRRSRPARTVEVFLVLAFALQVSVMSVLWSSRHQRRARLDARKFTYGLSAPRSDVRRSIWYRG